MGSFRLFQKLTRLTMGRLRRQFRLLAGLALLCIALPFLAGRGAEAALSQGVSFSGITLAVTAPEGDRVPELLERYMGNMTDIRQYCRVEALEYEAALEALRDGGVTAVLVLPEHFVQSVQWGENPNVRLIVDGGHPLESMLTLWVGQSAADLLAAVQAGIYAVLDLYAQQPPAGISYERAVMEINLEYVRWTLDRQDMFRTETLLPTLSLPISLHYMLSVFWFLILAMAPVFAWNFQSGWLACQRRLRYAARSPLTGFFSSLSVCAAVMAAVIFAGLEVMVKPSVFPALGVAALCALFFASYAGLCGLLSSTAAGCGCLSFFVTLAALFLAGGIVPPVLLPEALQRLEWVSPIAWMRTLTGQALGYSAAYPAGGLLAGGTVLCGALSGRLYCRRVREQEGAS